MIYFSASQNAFYDSSLFREDQLPADRTSVTPERYADLFAGLSQGLAIQADGNGQPVNAPRLPSASAITAQRVAKAKDLLAQTDIVVLRAYEAGMSFPAAWRTYRDALRSVVSGQATTLPTQPSGGVLAGFIGSLLP